MSPAMGSQQRFRSSNREASRVGFLSQLGSLALIPGHLLGHLHITPASLLQPPMLICPPEPA